MKTGFNSCLFAAVMVAMTILTACQKSPVASPVADEPSPPPVAVPKAASATPTVAAATPSADLLAPPGIFFLVQKLSITTDDGIVGLNPGQLIREVTPGVFEADGRKIDVRPSQMTNNLRIARQLASMDAKAQAALRSAAIEHPSSAAKTSAQKTVAATPTPATALAPTSLSTANRGAASTSRLGAGTGFADPASGNRKNARADSSGRLYWRDSSGNIRYDF